MSAVPDPGRAPLRALRQPKFANLGYGVDCLRLLISFYQYVLAYVLLYRHLHSQ